MAKSLLFLPDISGFTEFVQTTEIAHSQHVISELLEVLINANTEDLQLAEIEGDALFFYKEGEVPSLEKLLAQMESMFTAFYSHLKLLGKNRICPCSACSSAPLLELKIISHIGDIEFITVHNSRKPFGTEVIQVHRLMKNSVPSDNYVLLSEDLSAHIGLAQGFSSSLYDFETSSNEYDGKEVNYLYAVVDKEQLKLESFARGRKMQFDRKPNLYYELDMDISAENLLELITNYKYRSKWVEGVDEFVYDEDEVTRLGSEHICVINGKQLDFIAVTKEVPQGKLVYGEATTSPPPVDELIQFFVISPLSDKACRLEVEVFWEAKSPVKKLMIALLVKRILNKNLTKTLAKLKQFAESSDLLSKV